MSPQPERLVDQLRLWAVDRAVGVSWRFRLWYLLSVTVTSTFYALWLMLGVNTLVARYVSDNLLLGDLRFWSAAGVIAYVGAVVDLRWIRWVHPFVSLSFWSMWIAFALFGDHGGGTEVRWSTAALGLSMSMAALNALLAHWVGRNEV